ncbi:CbtA family protein [Streptomyces samsunensis]|uniref:CbtA family protein n=1 Tax=Streptomyces malaysiensis TaxID=92644 RepID=UPI001583D3DA|nr:CbtA family protein [Streptomyces samsunensis]MCC4314168.1 CbtA family protein [Streptomyces malaysiensis]NUH36169.1 CbtA family protein [Streptomyces samsunensis]
MNSISVRALLVRGMLAGLAAGLPALGVAYLLGEPRVDSAIAYEDAHSHEHGAELVSRTMQSTAGLSTGVLVYGVAFGGIAALAVCVALGRIGRFGPRATAALVSLGALVAGYLVPFFKYPANPPAVGDPETLDQRTTLYFLMVVLSVLLAVGAVILGRRLAPRLGNWNATVAAAVAFIVVVGLAYAFLPSFNEVPEGFPATLLWQFRLAALAVQCTLWVSFGLLFGHLAERLLSPRPTTADRVAATGATDLATAERP